MTPTHRSPPAADYLQLYCPHCRAVCNVVIEEIEGLAACWKCGRGFDPMAADETEETLDGEG